MPRKCESCRHFIETKKGQKIHFFSNQCSRSEIVDEIFPTSLCHKQLSAGVDLARDICDREGDGHFVYFEPRDPSAGAVVETAPEPKQMAKAA